MIRALIVDDESPARARLKRLLEKYSDIELSK
jgi:DNA-binding LytR/AlgR family response regulator